jgi:putative ABC transport system substrate-binding protein
VFDLNAEPEAEQRIIASITAVQPALLLTLGSTATRLAQRQFPELPGVFAMVMSPHRSPCMTGVTLDIPIEQQFSLLQSVLPRLRSAGVVYNPNENSLLIAEAETTAAAMGFTLIKKTITHASEVPQALNELKQKKIDCLWVVPDQTVFSSYKSVQFVILHTLQNRIPCMGLSSSFVKAGALLSLACSPEDIGAQAGEIAAEILAGTAPCDIPVAAPRTTSFALNARIARQLGIAIPPRIMAAAQEVYR